MTKLATETTEVTEVTEKFRLRWLFGSVLGGSIP